MYLMLFTSISIKYVSVHAGSHLWKFLWRLWTTWYWKGVEVLQISVQNCLRWAAQKTHFFPSNGNRFQETHQRGLAYLCFSGTVIDNIDYHSQENTWESFSTITKTKTLIFCSCRSKIKFLWVYNPWLLKGDRLRHETGMVWFLKFRPWNLWKYVWNGEWWPELGNSQKNDCF